MYAVMYGREAEAALVELLFRWSHLVFHLMIKPFGMLESIFRFFTRTRSALQKAYMHAPLCKSQADTLYLVPHSEPLEWFQEGFSHPLWTAPLFLWLCLRRAVGHVPGPHGAHPPVRWILA